ncbi:hypothetical protein [uncultured Mycobacterium sp.]|uniref:hypothetical protein n=1 Tax=uncultured Mycobacterium sp. TaxID=171292 RepID=UPI0035CABC4D
MDDDNKYLQDLLVAALHNRRPPVIEPPQPPTLGTSSIDQLVELLHLAANQDVESDKAQVLAGGETRNRLLTAAVNEAIQQETADGDSADPER